MKMAHTCYRVKDLDASIKFYQEAFGFEEKRRRDFLEYEFTLVNNFDTESAINYFDNQRRKSTGNIGGGSFIDRNIDISNEANIIFENVSFTEIMVDGNNILNSVINAPFNS